MKIQTNQETVDEIKKVIAENPEEGNAVRIYIGGFSCSGPSFGLALDNKNDDDLVYEEDGQEFVMEPKIFEEFGDFILEYSEGGYLVQPVDFEGGCGTCGGCH